MKKLKHKFFSLYPNVYPIQIHVAYGTWTEAIRYFRKKLKNPNLEVEQLEFANASCSAVGNDILLWFEPAPTRTASQFASLVAHEGIHAAFRMSQAMGQMFNPEVQEPLCYFVQYLVHNITHQVWEKKASTK